MTACLPSMHLFFNHWRSENMARPSQPYKGGHLVGGSKPKSLLSMFIWRKNTKGAIPLDNMDEGRHTEASSRDPDESRSKILHKGVMITREYSVAEPEEEKTPSYVENGRGPW